MPRLSHPKITKGHAIDALLSLYRNDREFVRELDKIRDPYLDLIIQLALDSFDSGRKSGLPPKEYFETVIEHAQNMQQGPSFFREASVYAAKLQPYFDALSKLAYRWNLRAPWAITMLVIYDMFDVFRSKGLMPDEIDMPLEGFNSLYPWPSPLPPLEIKVPAWAIVLQGREKVLAEVSRKLQQYEKEIKATGLTEHPSSLQKHAKWWFEHHVQGLTWRQIADEIAEVDPEGGPQPENIRKAVTRLSKLIGVSPEGK
jgi:hypothetical protein